MPTSASAGRLPPIEEVPTAKGAIVPTEQRGRTFLRGCLKHCGVCGKGQLFRWWFKMRERCPRCGLKFDRIEGHWTGDIGVNTIMSFGVLLIVLMGGFLLTYPDPPVLGLVLASIGTAFVAPLLFYPFSKTIWLAVDLMLRPLAAGEVQPGYGPQKAVRAQEGGTTGR